MASSSTGQRQEAPPYEQEIRLNNMFDELSDGFKKLDKLPDAKQQALLRDMTAQMQEAKSLIRDFERDAKSDNMPIDELNYRKKQLVQELNSFIGLKKAYGAQLSTRAELVGTAVPRGPTQDELDSMATQDLMEMGRKNIKETDQSLIRSERLVNDTISIGAQTAETLQVQGQQLSKISNDLDDIHFSMKKAQQVIRDMARGLATDKCLMGFLLLVVIAIVVVIVLKITGVGNVKV